MKITIWCVEGVCGKRFLRNKNVGRNCVGSESLQMNNFLSGEFLYKKNLRCSNQTRNSYVKLEKWPACSKFPIYGLLQESFGVKICLSFAVFDSLAVCWILILIIHKKKIKPLSVSLRRVWFTTDQIGQAWPMVGRT